MIHAAGIFPQILRTEIVFDYNGKTADHQTPMAPQFLCAAKDRA
jgi:hypothetical protein